MTRNNVSGEMIRAYRERIGLTQNEFAAVLGTSQALISMVEAGRSTVSRKLINSLRKKSDEGLFRPAFGEFIRSGGVGTGALATYFGVVDAIPLEVWKAGMDLRQPANAATRERVWVPGITSDAKAFSFVSPPALLAPDSIAVFRPVEWKHLIPDQVGLFQIRAGKRSGELAYGVAHLGRLIATRRAGRMIVQFEPPEGGPISSISEGNVEVMMTCLFRGRYGSL